jgi:hypothetical protein
LRVENNKENPNKWDRCGLERTLGPGSAWILKRKKAEKGEREVKEGTW